MKHLMSMRGLFVLSAVLVCMGMPAIVQAQPLSQLACASGVYCNGKVTPTDAQIILNLTPEQAQSKFIDASQDWDAAVWQCAAGGSCGKFSQLDAQTLIGLPEAAYGPAQQLRERGPGALPEPNSKAEKPAKPAKEVKPTSEPVGKPGIVVEALPKPGPGGPREILLPGNAAVSGDIQPQDGVWTLSAGSPRAVGCMAGIADQVARGMPGPQSGPITFEKPFNARQLVKSDKISWKRLGPNHYAGQLVGGSAAMTMGYDVKVTNTTQMQWQSVVTVRIPGQPVCTITTPLSHVRQGS